MEFDEAKSFFSNTASLGNSLVKEFGPSLGLGHGSGAGGGGGGGTVSTPMDENNQPLWGCLKNGNLKTYRDLNKTKRNHSSLQWGGNTAQSHEEYQQSWSAAAAATTPTPLPPQATTSTSTIPNYQFNIALNGGDAGTSANSPLSPPTIGSSADDAAGTAASSISGGGSGLPFQLAVPAASPSSSTTTTAGTGSGTRTIRRISRVTLGKNKPAKSVAVLIPNRTMRRRVLKQTQTFSKASMDDVRAFLQKKGLIKVGCSAPDNVLRQMFESTKMIGGDVLNHNADVLLYNFMNGDKSSNK